MLGTIPLGGAPEFAVTNKAGQIYVNIADKSEVVTIDVQRLRISTRSSLKACSEPTGIALDDLNHRLFVEYHNQTMAVVDAHSGQVKTTLPIGKGVDATAFDAATKLAFSANGEGTLTVIQEETPDQFRVIDNVVTQRGARTMALDLKTHHVFLVTAQFQPLLAPTRAANGSTQNRARYCGSIGFWRISGLKCRVARSMGSDSLLVLAVLDGPERLG